MDPTTLPDPTTPAEQTTVLTPQLSIGSCYARYDAFDVVVNLAYRYDGDGFAEGRVTCNRDEPLALAEPVVYRVGIHDRVEYSHEMSDVLYELVPRLEKHLEQGARVLVHCAAGRSRSGTVVVTLMALLRGWTYAQALRYVQSRRPIVLPNQGFAVAARAYLLERAAQARKT
jgi:Dual specificity phosphatase, catalytic domain